MSLIRYLFIASLVFVSCNNLTAFGVSSPSSSYSSNDSSIRSKIQFFADKRKERQKRQNFISQLNLTADQKQKILQIDNKYKQQIEQSRSNLSAAQKQLKQMLADNSSVNSIRDRHQEVTKYRQQLSEIVLDRMLEIREVLTVEQRSKFVELMQSRSGDRGSLSDN
jgi:periplasmic protein CpxP/Spy